MLKNIFLSLMILISTLTIQAQSQYKGFPSLVWPKLYDVRFEKAKDAQGEFEKPVFTKPVKSLEGKEVTVPGYMVPFENGMKGNHFIVSSLPLNACFFCGVGGPETVIEVFSKQSISYTEKPIEIKGTLKLNDKDPDKMMYVLENATLIGEIEF